MLVPKLIFMYRSGLYRYFVCTESDCTDTDFQCTETGCTEKNVYRKCTYRNCPVPKVTYPKLAYTGHFCPSTGADKSGKLGYFPSTGTENNIFPNFYARILPTPRNVAPALLPRILHVVTPECPHFTKCPLF